MSEGASKAPVGRVVVVGGGAAGFFGAMRLCRAGGGPEVLLLKKGTNPWPKSGFREAAGAT